MLDRFIVSLENRQGIVHLVIQTPTRECAFTDVYLRCQERVTDWRGRFGKRGWDYQNLRGKPRELDTLGKNLGVHGGPRISGLVLSARASAELSAYLDRPYRAGRDDAELIFEVGHDLWAITPRKGRTWTGDYKVRPY